MIKEVIISVIGLTLTTAFGFLSLYFKSTNDLLDNASTFIADAEEEYKDISKSGGLKFEYCVDKLFALVPKCLRHVITREVVGAIVQNTFDEVKRYATVLLDQAVDKMIK